MISSEDEFLVRQFERKVSSSLPTRDAVDVLSRMPSLRWYLEQPEEETREHGRYLLRTLEARFRA